MELVEFILDGKQFELYAAPEEEIAYTHADDQEYARADFDQTKHERDEDYNQDQGW